MDTPAPPAPTPLAIEDGSADRFTSRARPAFLYVVYALLLWSIPVGLIGAARPGMAQAIARSMGAYWNAIPAPLYALFATGYLGYTIARTWGQAKAAAPQGLARRRTPPSTLRRA